MEGWNREGPKPDHAVKLDAKERSLEKLERLVGGWE